MLLYHFTDLQMHSQYYLNQATTGKETTIHF